MSNKTSTGKHVGWYGADLDTVLNGRKSPAPGTKTAPVGDDPEALARLLG